MFYSIGIAQKSSPAPGLLTSTGKETMLKNGTDSCHIRFKSNENSNACERLVNLSPPNEKILNKINTLMSSKNVKSLLNKSPYVRSETSEDQETGYKSLNDMSKDYAIWHSEVNAENRIDPLSKFIKKMINTLNYLGALDTFGERMSDDKTFYIVTKVLHAATSSLSSSYDVIANNDEKADKYLKYAKKLDAEIDKHISADDNCVKYVMEKKEFPVYMSP